MKLIIKKTALIMLCLICCLITSTNVMAQRRKKKPSKKSSADKYFENKGSSLKSKLWYGGNLNFGLNSNYFAIGGKPMVGYKLTQNLSAGPILDISYRTIKRGTPTNPESLSSLIIGAGLFSRYKFLDMFFAHVEGVYQNQNITEKYNDSGGVERKEKYSEANFIPKMGLGYYAGSGGIGVEISILYDFYLKNNFPNQIPLEYRVGFNYNF